MRRPGARAVRRAPGSPHGNASCAAPTAPGSMISSSAPTAELAVATDLEAHLAVRHRVFVELQGLFDDTDRDARDEAADTVHVVACVDGVVVGTVRLYPLGDGLWKGDRL